MAQLALADLPNAPLTLLPPSAALAMATAIPLDAYAFEDRFQTKQKMLTIGMLTMHCNRLIDRTRSAMTRRTT